MSLQTTTQAPMDLLTLQREMAAAVMQPLTRDEGMRSRTADGRSMTAVAESFIAPNSRLTAFERLEIYNRQYWFRVLGALAEDFPAVRAVVGPRDSKRSPSRISPRIRAVPSRSATSDRTCRTGLPPILSRRAAAIVSPSMLLASNGHLLKPSIPPSASR